MFKQRLHHYVTPHMGHVRMIPSSEHKAHRIYREFGDGLRYGFPLCCVVHYCLDILRPRTYPSAAYRGGKHKERPRSFDPDGVYVPCVLHKQRGSDA